MLHLPGFQDAVAVRVDSGLDRLTTGAAVRTGWLGHNIDQAGTGLADVARLRDLVRIKNPVSIQVEPALDAHAASWAVCTRGFIILTDQRIHAWRAVGPIGSVAARRPLRARRTGRACRARCASCACRALRPRRARCTRRASRTLRPLRASRACCTGHTLRPLRPRRARRSLRALRPLRAGRTCCTGRTSCTGRAVAAVAHHGRGRHFRRVKFAVRVQVKAKRDA